MDLLDEGTNALKEKTKAIAKEFQTLLEDRNANSTDLDEICRLMENTVSEYRTFYSYKNEKATSKTIYERDTTAIDKNILTDYVKQKTEKSFSTTSKSEMCEKETQIYLYE